MGTDPTTSSISKDNHQTAPPPYSSIDPDDIREPSLGSLSSDSMTPDSSDRDEECEMEPKSSWMPQLHQRLNAPGRLWAPLQVSILILEYLIPAQGAPAPLAMLNTAGSIVGFVPNHWAQLAGGIVNVTAGLGTAATRIIRTKYFLDKVNRDYFEPRGLKASLCKSKSLAAKLGCGEQLPELLPITPETCDMNLQDRRMLTLEPYIAPLTFDVPPPSKERNFVDRMTEKQIERTLKKKAKKKEKRSNKIRESNLNRPRDESKYVDHLDGSLNDKKVLKLEKRHSKNQRKMEKAERKAAEKMENAGPFESKKIKRKQEKRIRKAEKECNRLEGREEEIFSKAAKKRNKRHAKDVRKVEKIEYLLIESLMGLTSGSSRG
ncbi:hypothetical protein CORC01_06104 [Colletotrichum orchidophilum]|uniref:Uncharacterized protein n=1 Tax=Colletotrichum orchidophilum TaxID=1209926 RepID=A0A1G4BB75_9PEZI|nr:uncharacterized protein CORC01_06104 [Colletotrichum orchidophilum]OHE98653.1 hypothetical protein CORC01_06104 [Colletotrichum orchidophilum]